MTSVSPAVRTTSALHVVTAIVVLAICAINVCSDRRVWDGGSVSCTADSRAPQQYGPLLFLELESLFKPGFQRASTVGGRPVGDASDVLFHELDRLRVFEVRSQKLALHFHDLFLAGRTR